MGQRAREFSCRERTMERRENAVELFCHKTTCRQCRLYMPRRPLACRRCCIRNTIVRVPRRASIREVGRYLSRTVRPGSRGHQGRVREDLYIYIYIYICLPHTHTRSLAQVKISLSHPRVSLRSLSITSCRSFGLSCAALRTMIIVRYNAARTAYGVRVTMK